MGYDGGLESFMKILCVFFFFMVSFLTFCMNISALINSIVLYKPMYILNYTYASYHNYGVNFSHSVFRCVHVSATKYVNIKEKGGDPQALAQRNVDLFSVLISD